MSVVVSGAVVGACGALLASDCRASWRVTGICAVAGAYVTAALHWWLP